MDHTSMDGDVDSETADRTNRLAAIHLPRADFSIHLRELFFS